MVLEYIKLFRVKDWVKNLFVFVPLLFSKHFFELDYLSEVILAFFSFSFISSVVYIINDIVDIEADRRHQSKKNRPLASGRIQKSRARRTSISRASH